MNASARRTALAVVPRATASPLTARSDDELMLLVRGGMHPAFDELVKRHQARILRIAARHLGDVSLARDVAKSAFLEVYRGRERYEARGKFFGYLCRIALNQCRMVARASRVSQRHDAIEKGTAELGSDVQLLRQRQRDLQLALSHLSEKLRVVVILRYGGDIDLAEIADTLDIPVGTVKRRLFDAMAKLRATLEDLP